MLTALLRCKGISDQLLQTHTVVTFDQALYYKAKILVWLYPELLPNFVICLGGFHTVMHFLSIIGKHMSQSGLLDVLCEANMYSQCIAKQIFGGKLWNHGFRAHKLTMEDLWRI